MKSYRSFLLWGGAGVILLTAHTAFTAGSDSPPPPAKAEKLSIDLLLKKIDNLNARITAIENQIPDPSRQGIREHQLVTPTLQKLIDQPTEAWRKSNFPILPEYIDDNGWHAWTVIPSLRKMLNGTIEVDYDLPNPTFDAFAVPEIDPDQ